MGLRSVPITTADGFCVAKASISRVTDICIEPGFRQDQLAKVYGPYPGSSADVKYVVWVLNRCKIQLAVQSFYEQDMLEIWRGSTLHSDIAHTLT
jgi:hypothetical protein